MPGDMSTPEMEQIRTAGRTFLERVIPNYKPPQTTEEAEEHLRILLVKKEKILQGAIGEERKRLEGEFTRAEFEARWQVGEVDVSSQYFEELDKAISAATNELRQERRDEAGRKWWIYVVGGKVVSEEEARIAAAKKVLADRNRRVRAVIEEIDGKRKREKLSAEDQGRDHAARVIDDYVHSAVVCQEIGASKRIATAIRDLEEKGDDLAGLDSSEANGVVEKEAKELPDPTQLADLVRRYGEVKAALESLGEGTLTTTLTTYLGRNVAEVIRNVVRDVTGREPTPAELTAGSGLDLEREAKKRISEATYNCAQHLIEIYEMGKEKRTGGIAALRTEMAKRGISEDLLVRPYRARGEEIKIKAIMDLDAAFRAVFEGQVSEFVPGMMFGGRFWAGLDPERARIVVIDLVGPEKFAKDFDLSTIKDPQQRLRAERARKLFGVDPSGREEDKYQGVAGYLNFIEWCMTGGGEYKDLEGKPISWVPGDPIDLDRIRQPTWIWFRDHVMGSVDPHLATSKKIGVDPNAVIEVVLMADLAKREGVDLEKFYQQVRRTDGSEAAIRKVAEDFCRGMRDTLKEVLVGKEREGRFLPGYLIKLAPVLTAEGRLNPIAVMERLVARPWGASEQWNQLKEAEADLFKHLSGEVKGKMMELFYEIGYEFALREFIAGLVGSKNIPDMVDSLTTQRFLHYRTRREMGLDFTNTLVQSIADFLKGNERWKEYGENLAARHVRTVKTDTGERVVLTDLPEEIREAVLMNLGVDINQPLPDRGYSAWRKNLDYLIENASHFGYSQKIINALRRFNGDPQGGIMPKDVVLEFKWRLARAAFEKYLSLGQVMLEKEKDLTVDIIWKRLGIEEAGLLSRAEYAKDFVGAWGGDRLGKELEEKLNPSLLRKIVTRPGLVLRIWMISFFDFVHGRSIEETKKLPIWARVFPDSGPTLAVLGVNAGVSILIQAARGAVSITPVFRAYPLIDNFVPFLRFFSEIPLRLSLGTIGLSLLQTLLPYPLSGLKVQGKLFSKFLELVNTWLVKTGRGRILSEKEVISVRTPEMPK